MRSCAASQKYDAGVSSSKASRNAPSSLTLTRPLRLLGLSASAWIILLCMAALMLFVSLKKGEGSFRARYLNDGWKLWLIASLLLLACLLFGAYGPGYVASDFIYGQF